MPSRAFDACRINFRGCAVRDMGYKVRCVYIEHRQMMSSDALRGRRERVERASGILRVAAYTAVGARVEVRAGESMGCPRRREVSFSAPSVAAVAVHLITLDVAARGDARRDAQKRKSLV